MNGVIIGLLGDGRKLPVSRINHGGTGIIYVDLRHEGSED